MNQKLHVNDDSFSGSLDTADRVGECSRQGALGSNPARSVVLRPWRVDVPTEIAPELLAAYQTAEYWVCGAPESFCLRVGHYSAPLAQLLQETNCRCAAFVSAHNPSSEPGPARANREAHERLRRTLVPQTTCLIDGAGRDAGGQWPDERSFLAIGLGLDASKIVGEQFGQNAIVWAGSDAIPRLILLR